MITQIEYQKTIKAIKELQEDNRVLLFAVANWKDVVDKLESKVDKLVKLNNEA